jgi:hypothetical protein
MSDFFGGKKPDFEFADEFTRPYLMAAHRAITSCKLWNWMQTFEPEEGRGFMFSIGVPELERLNEVMFKDPVNNGHSGGSYGYTMRCMQSIAKNGYKAFQEAYEK